jgi:hypothetical protein
MTPNVTRFHSRLRDFVKQMLAGVAALVIGGSVGAIALVLEFGGRRGVWQRPVYPVRGPRCQPHHRSQLRRPRSSGVPSRHLGADHRSG